MLFVYVNVNVTRGSIAQSWMVPSPVFEANTTVNARGRRVFWLFVSECGVRSVAHRR